MVEAVVFDLDGVLVDSEVLWNDVKREFVRETGGRWNDGASRDMLGMSSLEWSRYMHDEMAVPLAPGEIDAAVVGRMEDVYRERLPLIDGARQAVERVARWPLALASSSNKSLIELVLELAGLGPLFQAVVSSEEVERGKPAPDVYLEAARRLGVDPARSAAIEDSANGILSASGAGMRVIAVPNPAFPPESEALGRADVVLDSIAELDAGVVEAVRSRGDGYG
jgi:HAD superfamily hydrolase (TIGR01509 family)